VIAVDTNILVYAHVPSFPQHETALAALNSLMTLGRPWAIPVPCVHEFCSVVTHKNWRTEALSSLEAIDIVQAWKRAPHCHFIGTTSAHIEYFCQTLKLSNVVGGAIHDARIVATCLENDVTELWTADRDFSKFLGLKVRNPISM
jgi:uncharacterized protein